MEQVGPFQFATLATALVHLTQPLSPDSSPASMHYQNSCSALVPSCTPHPVPCNTVITIITPYLQARVEELREAAQKLGLAQQVDFCLGVSNQELRSLLGDAVGGLHTMLDEHFGISVVEYMAAGRLVPVSRP